MCTTSATDPTSLARECPSELSALPGELPGLTVFDPYSDICTCRPYLIYGMMEAIRCAQRGGVGLAVYYRKEGRSLGEVTKYLVSHRARRHLQACSCNERASFNRLVG